MKRPFREHHMFQILEEYERQHLPLDMFIGDYFRAHTACGSKDRKAIVDDIYGMIRWKGLLDALGDRPPSWEKRLHTYTTVDIEKSLADESIPLNDRYSFPKELFERLVRTYGEKRACELCYVSNFSAPTAVRVNTLKINRDELLRRWDGLYDAHAGESTPHSIVFNKKINFLAMAEFKQGLFEVQDEGSQNLALLVKALPGQQILDYCAGSGGKALAIAPLMHNKGQIYLHDVRSHALQQAKKRLKRAGVQNSQIVEAGDLRLGKIKKSLDWVLVDAPCSGSGTWRRNPDMKWRYEEGMIERLVGQQRTIFEKALSFMKPDGRIVYATCSLFCEENQQQIDHFIKTYGLEVEGEMFQSFPTAQGMDGFFGAVLRKKG